MPAFGANDVTTRTLCREYPLIPNRVRREQNRLIPTIARQVRCRFP